MKILVTGAAGFMGSWIVDELIKKKHHVYGIDDLSGGLIENVNPIYDFIKLDLRNKVRTEELISQIKPEVLYALAANARECASFFQPREVTGRNLMAYINVLEPCIKYGMKKVILYSSLARYGDQKAPFDETLPPKPVDVYASNKVAMEEITKELAGAHGFDWTIVIPHNVFGERQLLSDRFRNFLGITMNHIMRNEPVIIYGDGEQKRAFSYIKNSLPCYIRCLKEANSEVINIGGSVPKTINEVAAMIIAEFPSYRKRIKHLQGRYGEVKNAWVTCEKSMKLLGYEDKIDLQEGIKQMSFWAKCKGPQNWSKDQLSLFNEKVPETWR